MKKNRDVAKIFTLFVTVVFLASSLLVGCKDPAPEPNPDPTTYTVTYTSDGGGDSVTGIPESKTVEDGTVIKFADLPTLTAPEGWTFDGWYIGEEKLSGDYTVKSDITITAKFIENVANEGPDPETPVDPDPETPVDPDPETPVDPDPETPVDPDPETPVDPDPETPVDPNPDNPEEVDPQNPVATKYTVTYTSEIDGASNIPEAVDVDANGQITEPSPAPELSSYTFEGWYIGDEKVTFPYRVESNVTLVAKFTLVQEEDPTEKEEPEVPEVPELPTYYIPDVDSSWTNIVVWAWNKSMPEGVGGYVLQAENNNGTVTFESNVAYEYALVVKVTDSPADVTSSNIWDMRDGTESTGQTGNYELGENNTYKEEEVVLSETKIYLKPNSNWNVDNARFAAYFFNNGTLWCDMNAVGDGTYECVVPEGFSSVIFCRMNPSTTENNWENKWNQTSDLTVPTDGTNLYTVKDGTWETGGGTWSTKQ